MDLDLDLIRRVAQRDILIDDEDEFEAHIGEYAYPDDLVAVCRWELERVRRAMEEGRGPLSDEAFDWRPGDELDEALLLPA